MSKFTDFIDNIVDKGKTLAKEDLKKLVENGKKDQSDFVRKQAKNLERWTLMLAEGELTPEGYKKLVQQMEVLNQLETIKIEVGAKASAQRLADGIQKLVIDGLFGLI